MSNNSENLLTAEQVADLLQLKPSTIYAAAAQGRIPSIRLWAGSRRALVRFSRQDIESLIESKRIVTLQGRE